MTMTNTITTTKTKMIEELAAAASSLRKDIEEIAGLIASLTRYLLPLRAVDVDVDDFSVNQEE